VYVKLPADVAKNCAKYANGLRGGAPAWGTTEMFGDTSFDPFVLADRIVDGGLECLALVFNSLPWGALGFPDGYALPSPASHAWYSEKSGIFVQAYYGVGSGILRKQPRG
jgi:hypothetical protein